MFARILRPLLPCVLLVASGQAQTLQQLPFGDRVRVVRDDVGVPHVFAKSSEGAFYGLGWATARDRLLQMDIQRRMGRGEVSEVFTQAPFPRALIHDQRARLVGWGAKADDLAANMTDPELHGFLVAYSRGVNDYVASLNGELPPVFASFGIPRFDPWTPGDCLVVWLRVQDAFDSAWEKEVNKTSCNNGSPIIDPSGATVPCPYGTSTCRAPSSSLLPRLATLTTREETFLKASNAWTVAGSHTTTGEAVLHSDPQLFIQAPSFWYEYHLSGGDFDCRGIGVPGFPPVFVGWNQDIAWGATALGGDASDLYELQPGSAPNTYVLDGVETPMTNVHTETIQVKGGSPVQVTYRETVWGPVVTDYFKATCHIPSGSAREVAVKHLALEDDRHSFEGLVALNRASDWCSARLAIRDYRSPAIHWLYADADGHIGYTALTHIPVRPPSDPCFGAIPLDGSTITSDWQGTIPLDQMPWSFDPTDGFIVSANNMAADPACNPMNLVIGTSGDTLRSWRLRERISRGLSGGNKMTPQDVLAVHQDAVNPALRVFSQLAIQMWQGGAFSPRSDASKAASALANDWNVHLPADAQWSVYTSLPIASLLQRLENQLVSTFRQPLSFAVTFGGGQPGLSHFLKNVEQSFGSWTGDPAAIAWAESLLDDAWRNSSGGPLDGRFDVLYLGRLRQPLCGTVCGGGNDCSLHPAFDFTAGPLQVTMGNTILSQQGNSYSQWVNFADLDGSRSVLPPGISEDPASPLFRSNEAAWVAGELNPGAALTESVVLEGATAIDQLLYVE
ncbi:MAG: penicillin acylase family protein [Planctomycetota bacterium]